MRGRARMLLRDVIALPDHRDITSVLARNAPP